MNPKEQTSTFYAAQITTTFCFARLSDHLGRKLVFLACAIGLSISINGFGLSTMFWALIPWFVQRLNLHNVHSLIVYLIYSQALMGGFSK